MAGKEISMSMVSRGVVRHSERPAIFTLVVRLLAPMDQVQARLRHAQASLEEAVARLESPALTKPGRSERWPVTRG